LGNDNIFQSFVTNKNNVKLTESIETDECDETKGMRMVLMKSDSLDRYECVSLYPMFFGNNGRMLDHVCRNGHVNYYNLKNTAILAIFAYAIN